MIDEKIERPSIRSILLVSLSNLGDIILTTPVLQRLSAEFPEAVIDVSCGAAGKEIFSNHPAVREVMISQRHRSIARRLRNISYLRKRKYDLVVDLKRTMVPFFLKRSLRSPVSPSAFLGLKRDDERILHKREQHLLLLRNIGIDISDAGFFVPISIYDCRAVDELLKGSGDKDIVLLNPGSKSHLKRWDAKKYALLSDRLVAELGCQVMVAGNEDDEEVVDELMSSTKQAVKNICCEAGIGELMEIMRRVSLVVTNDSAPLHMASAVNAPTIAIFGPSDERKYGPLSDKSRVITPEAVCRPCGTALCSKGPDEGCISRITVEEVFEAAREMLVE